jgi:hypothetical protein
MQLAYVVGVLEHGMPSSEVAPVAGSAHFVPSIAFFQLESRLSNTETRCSRRPWIAGRNWDAPGLDPTTVQVKLPL